MYTYTFSLSLKLTSYFCDIFLNTEWLYIIVNDLIKKPTGFWEREGRSLELSANAERSKMGMPY